jgi:hypothetical protein
MTHLGGTAMNCQDNHTTTSPQPSLPPQLELAPEDWFLATWRTLPPLTMPEPINFDFDRIKAQLNRARRSRMAGCWEWEDVDIPINMSRQEAQLWLEVMLEGPPSHRPRKFVPRFLKRTFDGNIVPDRLEKDIRTAGPRLPGKVLLPLLRVFSPAKIIDLLLPPATDTTATYIRGQHDREVAQTFATMVVPYLTADERKQLRERLLPELRPEHWQNTWNAAPPVTYRLAALLGMHAEVEAVVNRWNSGDRDPWCTHLDIIFGLGDAKRVEQHARRLGCQPTTPRHLRAWLAHTELSALDWIAQGIRTRPAGEITQFIEVLCLVRSPAAASIVLELKQAGLGQSLLRRWLDRNVGSAIAGLLPLAAGRGKLAEAALAYVQRAQQRGHTTLIEDELRHAPAEAAARVHRLVLDREAKTYPQFVVPEMPSWLYHAQFESKAASLPDWLVLCCLPPLVIGEERLNAGQVSGLINALKDSPNNLPDGLLRTVKSQIGAERLDAFAGRLFELWQGDGCPATDSWVLNVVGTIGGDDSALKISAAIRDWAKRRQLVLVQRGLAALNALNSDASLLQLNRLAQQGSQRWVREKARETMNALAATRLLTQDQLDDLSVPDLGLDVHGGRDLDYGPRHFRIILGPDLKPTVREESGRNRSDLPRPRKDDDPDRADSARREWNRFKLQLREAVKLQAQRLERSLIQARRWSTAEFRKHIGQHPLMAQLARRLLWGGFDEQHRCRASFRVTEEGTFADMHDREVSLDTLPRIGLVHPAHLTEEQRHAWGELFGDYEIVPPFPQLGRSVFTLRAEEENAQALRVGAGVVVSQLAILSGLSALEWKHRWAGVRGMSRYYPGHDVTAILELSGWRERALGSVWFFRGNKSPNTHVQMSEALLLGDLDPALLSEVAAEVTRLAAKGHIPA